MHHPVALSLALSSALVLAACGQKEAPAPAAEPSPAAAPMAAPVALARSVALRCGDQDVAATFSGDTAELVIAGETFALRRVVTASGAKYATDDGTTSIWNKGDENAVELRGQALPACVSTAPAPFKARGNEPGWNLEIGATDLVLVSDYGNKRTAVPVPAAVVADGRTTYTADTAEGPLVATVIDQRCADAATGMPHPKTVEVTHGSSTLRGCGGKPADLLVGAEWVVEDINGAGIVDNSRATIQFTADGKVNGRASCNNYMGAYTLTGEGLTFGKAASTMKACVPALMDQERKFLDALGAVRRFEVTDDGALVLRDDAKGSITARRG